MKTYNGLPVIELRETKKKTGFFYEAVKDGVVIATRNSVRHYVAALIYENDHKIASGVGRMDLLPAALKNKPCHYIAIKR